MAAERARVEEALIPCVLDGNRFFKALERIRAILDAGPHAYDERNIKATLAGVLGPFEYSVRPPCP